MNSGNIVLLKEKLRYLGFGEAIASGNRIDIEVQKGSAAFQIETAACFDEWTTAHATLFFRKSDEFDLYFFTKYEALLYYPEGGYSGSTQTFHIKYGNGVTFKEAYNLLQGRAVYATLWDTEGTKYSTWIQLSFSERTRDDTNYRVRQFGKNYSYDLEKALNTYPIRELQDEKLKMNLLCSLRKGNSHPVTFMKANKMQKMFVEACPATKGLKIYSEAMRVIQKLPGRKT